MLVQVPSAVICSLLHGLNFFSLTETQSEILVTLSYLQIYWREVKNSSVSKDLNWLQKKDTLSLCSQQRAQMALLNH